MLDSDLAKLYQCKNGTKEINQAVKNNPDISDEDKKYIFDQLKANFEGECSEVGMYLAMARVAHREGYPEIGLYYEKAAWEEAEHAAKFAELLGEVVTDSTKKNLDEARHGKAFEGLLKRYFG